MFFHDSICAHRTFSSSTNNFTHAQTLSRMSSLSDHMNIARVNIEFFTGCKKIKQRRISFVLGYLRMILWKISTAISIKHRILATFNIEKKINSDSVYAFKGGCGTINFLLSTGTLIKRGIIVFNDTFNNISFISWRSCSCIVGGNRRTLRKQHTCCKSLTN